ncbi:hypothetical protein HX870_09925 [Pseudomonas gingeri]|uniref:Uncharacterized protein n=1 Tax=Pseudomonas gingeri TaxID=117681 RepID=A0A7Y7X8B7_9PSED|nr:hypothetical protein [Pseudomonas gingeri]NWA26400.1 hypothetical protein [Pseudomonas gingeri]NWB94945.1 hypothetical protein [Pseudomonas gingeri]NWD67913.1 hypothetical protein [Pseudomonas gingeri]NWD75084.1 hypothetical protein [Pseudomonas gingeri]
MKRAIVAVIALTALTITTVRAEDLSPVPVTPKTGAPSTATPTPSPQITPRTPPKAGEPLPSIELPQPPKDQTLPGPEQNDKADKNDKVKETSS